MDGKIRILRAQLLSTFCSSRYRPQASLLGCSAVHTQVRFLIPALYRRNVRTPEEPEGRRVKPTADSKIGNTFLFLTSFLLAPRTHS